MIKRVPILEGDLDDHQVGSDDILTGISTSTSILVGDAGQNILDHAVGGNDTFSLVFSPQPNLQNSSYGDARGDISDHAAGGNDAFSLSGNSLLSFFSLYGDAGAEMSGHAAGGNDTFSLTVTSSFSSYSLFGDAGTDISGHAKG